MPKLICAVILIITSNYIFGQTKNRFEIKTNLLNLVAKGPSAGFEYGVSKDWSVMLAVASGQMDYGDFGGITRYKTVSLEGRKYFSDQLFFIGPYFKNIEKQVSWNKTVVGGTIPISIGKDRNFIGHGLSAGVTTGVKFSIYKKFKIELNYQLGYGHYYQMADKYNNLPSGNYLDTRIGLWLGCGW